MALLRLLRSEDMELWSRELGVTAAMLSKWRDVFLAAGAKAFKKRPVKVEAEVQRLNAKNDGLFPVHSAVGLIHLALRRLENITRMPLLL